MITTADRIAEVLYNSEAALRAVDREVITLRAAEGVHPASGSSQSPGCAEPPETPDFKA